MDDLIAYLRSDDEVFLVPNAANAGEVARRLQAAAPPGLTVADEHRDHAILAVQGPRSPDVLAAAGLPCGFGYMSFVDATWRGRPVTVCRSGYTGEHGYEVLPGWADAEPMWDALLAAGASAGLVACGLGARDTLRTEMGYPLHGQDLSESVTPVQAGLGWAVGWDKERFWGRERLRAEKAAGPARRLWGLRARDRAVPRPHMEVRTSDPGGPGGPVRRRGHQRHVLPDPAGGHRSGAARRHGGSGRGGDGGRAGPAGRDDGRAAAVRAAVATLIRARRTRQTADSSDDRHHLREAGREDEQDGHRRDFARRRRASRP